jgi:hypothetical protein
MLHFLSIESSLSHAFFYKPNLLKLLTKHESGAVRKGVVNEMHINYI